MEEQDKKKLEAVKLRMEKLAEELEKHNKAYYIDNAPTVSDEIYDSLFQELARLEKEYPQFKRSGFTDGARRCNRPERTEKSHACRADALHSYRNGLHCSRRL